MQRSANSRGRCPGQISADGQLFCNARDYDVLVAHTTIVFLRYMFLAYQHRMETDDKTFGELFYACCDEVSDISFVESFYRIMTFADNQLKKLGSYCEKTATAFFDAAITTALQCSGFLEKRKLASCC